MEISQNIEMRNRIIENCKIVFRKKHFADISMEDFAKATKMGRSSLYYYFKNKFEVFQEIAILEYSEILNEAMSHVSFENPLCENLKNYYKTKIKKVQNLTVEKYPYILEDVKTIPALFKLLMDETHIYEKTISKISFKCQ